MARKPVGEKRTAYRILVERHEGKRPLGRNMRILNDNIQMDHEEIRREGVDNMNLAEDRERVGLLLTR